MTEQYLVRKEDAADKYFTKINEVLSVDLDEFKARDFITAHTSFDRYCDEVEKVVSVL